MLTIVVGARDVPSVDTWKVIKKVQLMNSVVSFFSVVLRLKSALQMECNQLSVCCFEAP